MAKVKCQDCRLLESTRCLSYLKYMDPDKPRHCRRFWSKQDTTLWETCDVHE